MEKRNLISDNDANLLDRLTSNISALKHFINQLKQHKETNIKKLYIVLDDDFQIELTGVFGTETTSRIFDLLIQSRERRLNQLETKLIDLSDQIKNIQPCLSNEA